MEQLNDELWNVVIEMVIKASPPSTPPTNLSTFNSKRQELDDELILHVQLLLLYRRLRGSFAGGAGGMLGLDRTRGGKNSYRALREGQRRRTRRKDRGQERTVVVVEKVKKNHTNTERVGHVEVLSCGRKMIWEGP